MRSRSVAPPGVTSDSSRLCPGVAFHRKANVAVLASLAIGVVLTLASGELRADRDIDRELLRVNEALVERVAQQQDEIDELRVAIAAASKPPSNAPGTTAPSDAPKTKAQTEAEEAAAFRKKVLAAVKPELTAIDERATTAKETFDKHVAAYAKHTHDYERMSSGWVKLDTMLTNDALEILRPTYADDWIAIRRDGKGGDYTQSTSKPK